MVKKLMMLLAAFSLTSTGASARQVDNPGGTSHPFEPLIRITIGSGKPSGQQPGMPKTDSRGSGSSRTDGSPRQGLLGIQPDKTIAIPNSATQSGSSQKNLLGHISTGVLPRSTIGASTGAEPSFRVKAAFVDARDIDLDPALHMRRLPNVDDPPSSVIDHNARKCIATTFTQVRRDSQYVDNGIARAVIRPHWENLKVDEMVLFYQDGTTRHVPWDAIDLQGKDSSATVFERYDGTVFPVSAAGWRHFDATNTPNIAYLKDQFLNELAERSDRRVEIASIVYAFGGPDGPLTRLGKTPAASMPRFNMNAARSLPRFPLLKEQKAEVPLPNRPQLPAAPSGRVVPNKLEPHEVRFAEKIVEMRGGRLVGAPRSSMPGIDGTLEGKSVSLKSYASDNPMGVLSHVKTAEEQAKNVGYRGVEVFVDAPNVRARALLEFASGGRGELYQIPHRGTIDQITIRTKDGWVTISGTSGPDVGGFRMGEGN